MVRVIARGRPYTGAVPHLTLQLALARKPRSALPRRGFFMECPKWSIMEKCARWGA